MSLIYIEISLLETHQSLLEVLFYSTKTSRKSIFLSPYTLESQRTSRMIEGGVKTVWLRGRLWHDEHKHLEYIAWNQFQ